MKKILSCILITVSLLFALIVPIYATDEDDGGVVATEWTLTKNESVLIKDGKTVYTFFGNMDQYSLTFGFTQYVFHNTVTINGDEAYIYSYNKDGEIVYLATNYSDEVYIYATTLGESMLENFVENKQSGAVLYNRTQNEITKGIDTISDALDGITSFKAVKTSQLSDLPIYEIYYQGLKNSLLRLNGGIYDIDGELLYVNYDMLEDGTFGSESGITLAWNEVCCAIVPDDVEALLNLSLSSGSTPTTTYLYEIEPDGYEGLNISEETARAILIIIIVLIGIIFPLVPAVYAIVKLARRRGDGVVSHIIMLASSVIIIGCAIALIIILF